MSVLNKSYNFYNLNELNIGQSVKVINILENCDPYYRQRLLAQGVVPGAIMQIKKIAPFGDPIELLLSSGRSFIVRRSEASIIRVIKLDIL